MNIFVSGTDTAVGKTVVSAALCMKLGWRYWKPIQSGTNNGSDSDWIKTKIAKFNIEPESYCLKNPLSPHLAARLEDIEIDEKYITSIGDKINHTVIEGAGGLLVPINERVFMIDLIKELKAPLILVARSGLGTINHTLLSIEAIKKRSINMMGVIMVGGKNPENKNAIEYYGQVNVLGEIPIFPTLDNESLEHIGKSIIL